MEKIFAQFANKTSQAAGRPWTFCICLALVLVWAVSGPMFQFSETWQLVINTGTTIVTFLMVFLIQNTQNRDNAALQAKLDILILTSEAENEFIGIEKLTDKELAALLARCEARAQAHADAHERVRKEVSRREKDHPRKRPAARRTSSTAKARSPGKARKAA
jgi:low affinity Fe/Cu permease